jgi:hypothetical protein
MKTPINRLFQMRNNKELLFPFYWQLDSNDNEILRLNNNNHIYHKKKLDKNNDTMSLTSDSRFRKSPIDQRNKNNSYFCSVESLWLYTLGKRSIMSVGECKRVE